MVLYVLSGIVNYIVLSPILITFLAVVFSVSSVGKAFGLRRLYVNFLLRIFEYGRVNIERIKGRNSDDEDEEDSIVQTHFQLGGDEKDDSQPEKTEELLPNGNSLHLPSEQTNGKTENGHLKNGATVPNGLQRTLSSVISKNAIKMAPDMSEDHKAQRQNATNAENFDFKLENCLDYMNAGIEAIIEDDVTSRFEAEEIKNWNLLTRTNRRYEFITWRLTVIWVFGFFIRYFILMPIRVFICFCGVAWAVASFAIVGLIPVRKWRRLLNDWAFKMTFIMISGSLSADVEFHNKEFRPKNCGFCVANHTSPIDIAILSTDCTYSLVLYLTLCTAIVGCWPDDQWKPVLVQRVLIHCFSVLSSALSPVVTYHNEENKPKKGICVANHTSPIDALVLMCDNCYSLIGQRHGGFLGVLQKALSRASPHIWFERAESKDRHAVAQRLKDHVSNPKNPPILIFPEGTCINNTSVMQFKKGSFEVGGVIYPVAIKYDARFGDAFWNSAKYSMMQHLFLMMTSWAIVCDVWYLPPMYQQEGESAIAFANRVKSVIAKQGGLVDLIWDGQLKRNKARKEWKEQQQEEFTKRLKANE